MSAELDVSGGDNPSGGRYRHYKLHRLTLPLFDPLPETLLVRKDEILNDLKEALVAFGDAGLFSIWTKPLTFTFEFYKIQN